MSVVSEVGLQTMALKAQHSFASYRPGSPSVHICPSVPVSAEEGTSLSSPRCQGGLPKCLFIFCRLGVIAHGYYLFALW